MISAEQHTEKSQTQSASLCLLPSDAGRQVVGLQSCTGRRNYDLLCRHHQLCRPDVGCKKDHSRRGTGRRPVGRHATDTRSLDENQISLIVCAEITCSVDPTGSAIVNSTDVIQKDWSVIVGQTVVSQCPAAGHGPVSRFDDGIPVRSSKCVAGREARMTRPVTNCQGI